MEELIQRAQQGDGEAFAQLIESQKQTMYKVARGYLHSDADAADAIGETGENGWDGSGTSPLLFSHRSA